MSHVFPASLQAPRSRLSHNGPELSRIVAGMWRIGEWNM
ncbi:MAG: oxidoreductase, partial [Janthinobacterium lividum]|nr:oxidoreductase [Janthinobacterium lividum]